MTDQHEGSREGYAEAYPEIVDPPPGAASDVEALDGAFDAQARAGGRRRRRTTGSRLKGCLPVLVVLAIVAGLGYVGVSRGVDFLRDQFAAPEDYPGPGSGEVTFEVVSGDSTSAIGRNLAEQDIVASAQAFVDVASGNPDANAIQPGFYPMMEQMSAQGALDVLIDPAQAMTTRIVVPEGYRNADVVDILVDQTDFNRAQFERVLESPQKLGLPDYAESAEGYLFPATYSFAPNATPATMLQSMVERYKQAAADVDLVRRAEALGYTPHELLTVASLVEAEARGDDMPKVARVIYNRLENPGTAGTIGRLEIDATVGYALGIRPGVALTSDQIATESPYNTRQVTGLPPGPIDNPGEAAMEAAAAPADGDWYYYVTTNLRTGETKFASSYDEFLEYKAEYQAYCDGSDAC